MTVSMLSIVKVIGKETPVLLYTERVNEQSLSIDIMCDMVGLFKSRM